MQSTKPFFLALESVLKSRLPADEFAQVMEESLWEFEAGTADRDLSADKTGLARLGTICLAFFRAMIKTGISPESALETLAVAGRKLGWRAMPGSNLTHCSLATYFRSKNALPLCRAVFCSTCRENRNVCALADSEPADWSRTGAA